jgi:hypothetical protein
MGARLLNLVVCKMEHDIEKICGNEITGMGYRKNEVVVQVGKIVIVFGADKDGNLLINGERKCDIKSIGNF